ncbi:hypothetical protein F4802DRAFT_500475 [Xylaria palmicola]|nr:hypothetical protein F4802DRAFT_500475 [Xylaria palmicola]
MMNAANTGPQTMAASHHAPPAGRQHRPRRKSLEQLEAKYKALMRNMLMYQQIRKRNMGGAAGVGPSVKTEGGATEGRVDEKSQQQQQQHLMYHAQQGLPTPSSSVSPASSTTNLEEASISKQNRPQHHQYAAPALREQQRERPPQKRLQNTITGPKSAYDRRDTGSSARHARPAGRSMPAAMQLAYEELASIQRQQTPSPQQHQQQHQFHHQTPQQTQQQQQRHQGGAPIPIPRPTNIQIPPHYLQHQSYMHHLSPIHAQHHQPLVSPLPTPPHLDPSSYTTQHALPTISAPYTSYDTGGIPTRMDQHPPPPPPPQQQQQHHQPHHHHLSHQQHHGMPSFEPNGNVVDGNLLDCFVPNMSEM